MARQITPRIVGTLLSAVFVLALVGYLGYLYLVGTKAPTISPTATAFKTGVLTTDLDPNNKKSVFIPVTQLSTTTTNTNGGVTYIPSELGKTDITEAGK